MRKRSHLIKFAVTVAIIALIVSTVDWQQALIRLTQASWQWMAVGLTLNICGLLISAWRWQRLLNVLIENEMRLIDAIRFYWIGKLFSTVLPSNIGGDVVRMSLARRFGPLSKILTSIVIERATGFLLIIAIGLIAMLLFPKIEEILPMRNALIAVAAVGLLSIPFVFSQIPSWLARFPEHGWSSKGFGQKLANKLQNVGSSIEIYRQTPREIWLTFAISMLFYVVQFSFQGSMIHAVGGELTPLDVLCAAPFVMLISALPLSINGIGLGEGAFVLLYVLVGVDSETALAAAVLRRLTITFIPLIGVIPWLHERNHEGGIKLVDIKEQ